MKKLIIILLTAIIVASCGSGKTEAQEIREIIESYYDNPNLKKHYKPNVISLWHDVYENCGNDVIMLKSHQEFLLEKVLDAEYVNTLKEAGVTVE